MNRRSTLSRNQMEPVTWSTDEYLISLNSPFSVGHFPAGMQNRLSPLPTTSARSTRDLEEPLRRLKVAATLGGMVCYVCYHVFMTAVEDLGTSPYQWISGCWTNQPLRYVCRLGVPACALHWLWKAFCSSSKALKPTRFYLPPDMSDAWK